MVLVDEHNSALPYSHAEWAHSNLGHYQVSMRMMVRVMVMVMLMVMVMIVTVMVMHNSALPYVHAYKVDKQICFALLKTLRTPKPYLQNEYDSQEAEPL